MSSTASRDLLLSLSTPLVEPFRSIEVAPPLKQTGVVDFPTLIAIEIYVVGTLVLVTGLVTLALLTKLGVAVWRWQRNRSAPTLRRSGSGSRGTMDASR